MNEPCVIAKCPTCKAIVMAAADIPKVMDAECRAEIGDLAMQGFEISRVDAAEVRVAVFGCKCKKNAPT